GVGGLFVAGVAGGDLEPIRFQALRDGQADAARTPRDESHSSHGNFSLMARRCRCGARRLVFSTQTAVTRPPPLWSMAYPRPRLRCAAQLDATPRRHVQRA